MNPTNLSTLNNLVKADFVDLLAHVFEHSPWVADGAYHAVPFVSIQTLHAEMVETVERAGEEKQLTLIRAHPDLAGKAARASGLSAASSSEQAGAGLDRLSEEEFARFHQLNNRYKERFNFPFILAVKEHNKRNILAAFETRLNNDQKSERQAALAQIYQIARFRLDDLIAKEG